ncbi:hypothetical protein G8O24_11675 [Bradyrhizobium sp. INPA01-394B]|uniref:Uncharacterized protein n=1 Tax=Bradyrhizobium campsiandrae TaxID=1729892 RepID=A0ABR7U452_9BRAD|nr:hypothetical protein [Bradyrhizobium campsiandrae]MBC9878001.1 hypothetical protein [Bradyrhizobium campsiandrae]MBC9978345.1 hypothetical protein [Bradyrhizobium campsiandrae]
MSASYASISSDKLSGPIGTASGGVHAWASIRVRPGDPRGDDAVKLAEGLRAALDKTASTKS